MTMLLVTGCTTLEGNRPSSFDDAEYSLQRLKDRDVEEVLPTTVKRAEAKYDEAVSLLKKSRREDSQTIEVEAISKAIESQQIANNADRLFTQIQAWDSDEMELQTGLAIVDDYNYGGVGVTFIEPNESPFAKLQGTEILSTLAFFEPGSAEVADKNGREVESISEILTKDPNFKVTLVGYADFRGDEEANNKLGLERAENVAKILREYGVQDSQIELRSAGESEAMAEESHPNRTQLDRRVQAELAIQ